MTSERDQLTPTDLERIQALKDITGWLRNQIGPQNADRMMAHLDALESNRSSENTDTMKVMT